MYNTISTLFGVFVSKGLVSVKFWLILNFLISFSSDFGYVFIAEITDPQLSAKALIKLVVNVRTAVTTLTYTHTYIHFSKGLTINKC